MGWVRQHSLVSPGRFLGAEALRGVPVFSHKGVRDPTRQRALFVLESLPTLENLSPVRLLVSLLVDVSFRHVYCYILRWSNSPLSYAACN